MKEDISSIGKSIPYRLMPQGHGSWERFLQMKAGSAITRMWKAEKWEPKAWAELFRKAGAQYVVLTTKHHDGFCLFPSDHTDFNSVKMGPMKDIIGELTDAVRAEGLRMGLYYSGLIDWQFANDPIFTGENWNACPTFAYADYSYNQMKELVDKYHPSILWNDIGWPKQSEHAMPYLMKSGKCVVVWVSHLDIMKTKEMTS